MDAGGAGHLGQALDGGFHVLPGNQHQIGHFIDDDDDERQRIHVQGLLLGHRLA